jgi:Skp family chaperone for outer membrane proteins
VDEINKATPAADPKALQGKRFQAESMQRELKNKAEDAEQAFKKRVREMVGPIEEDLHKAIASYAERRGISFVLDLDRAQDLILYVAESANITSDFINEYNRRSPSSSAPTKPSGN